MRNITELSAVEISKRIKSFELTVKECVIAFAEEIKQKNDALGAFVKMDLESAFAQAVAVQRKMDRKEPVSVLAGVPFAVCENIFVDGCITQCGSEMLDGFRVSYSATVVERMKKAGAILIGQVNMSEFGISPLGTDSCHFAMKNPWDQNCSAGSSGAGAAVVTGMAPIVIGTDNGGGVGISSAFCGASSLVPSEGTVSRYGVFSSVPSVERIAVSAKSASDAAAVLQIIAGSDGKDPVCTRRSVVLPMQNVDIFKIGVPSELTVNLSPEIRARVLSVPEGLRQLGAEVDLFSMPAIEKGPAALSVISCAEIFASLARYDGKSCTTEPMNGKNPSEIRGERFTYETKRRILLGGYVLNAENYDSIYNEALKIRKTICAAFEKIFSAYNIIIAPVTYSTAPVLGGNVELPAETMSMLNAQAAVFLAGLPSVIIPCGYTQEGMPVGCQIIGKKNTEANILSAAVAFQNVTGYHELTAKV